MIVVEVIASPPTQAPTPFPFKLPTGVTRGTVIPRVAPFPGVPAKGRVAVKSAVATETEQDKMAKDTAHAEWRCPHARRERTSAAGASATSSRAHPRPVTDIANGSEPVTRPDPRLEVPRRTRPSL
tara:strand:- start:764 stop:1141 length:378 start_codon:yes stop_codon:yes gene_type:complete